MFFKANKAINKSETQKSRSSGEKFGSISNIFSVITDFLFGDMRICIKGIIIPMLAISKMATPNIGIKSKLKWIRDCRSKNALNFCATSNI